jgi:glycosyltransferase involved in cell wall biosynthesis
MSSPFRVAYISRTRLRLIRASVIQTLRTAAAMQKIGLDIRLYMPKSSSRISTQTLVMERGISEPLNITLTPLLSSQLKRWGFIGYRPFVARHHRTLTEANALYTRASAISLALAKAGLRHSFEVHDFHQLVRTNELRPIIKAHQHGTVQWMVSTCQAIADSLADAGADPRRLCVAPNGADLDDFSVVPPLNPAHLDHPRIVYAGRVSGSRGLQIFKTIAERGIADVSLVGEQEHAIQPTRGLNVFPAVPHREIPEWYKKTDIVLLPYQWGLGHIESISPVKLFEAMASGRPVIASDVPSIREIIEHGKTALLVDPDDINAWVQAVELLKRDRDLAVRLGAAARALAPKYSWHSRAEHIARTLGWSLPGHSA